MNRCLNYFWGLAAGGVAGFGVVAAGLVAAGFGAVEAPAGYAWSYNLMISGVTSMFVEAKRIGEFCAEESKMATKPFSRA